MKNLQFSESYVSLQQEGCLIRSCLLTGLNALSGPHAGDKGAYYTAFFQLSIGLERAMKVIFIMEYMGSNALQRPTTSILKRQGHKLVELIESMRCIPSDNAPHPLVSIQTGSIEWEILEHLSEFATGARYFNLDHGGSGSLEADPLKRWDRILARILREDVPPMQRERTQKMAQHVAGAISEHVFVLRHGLDRSLLSTEASLVEPALAALAAPYAVYRTLLLIAPLQDLLRATSYRVHALNHTSGDGTPSVPYMHEFLDFVGFDKKSALAKKRWP